MRYESCAICGRPTATSKAGVMRQHQRTIYFELSSITVQCRGANRSYGPDKGSRFTPEPNK